MPLAAALGCVLAEELRSPFALPVFDNSAMDGFAFLSQSTDKATRENPVRLSVHGTTKAGGLCHPVQAREARRIMTGAPIPKGADTVMVQEKAEMDGHELIFREPFPKARNIRYQGEELKKGKRVLAAGTVLNPATVGIFSGFGLACAPIYKKPHVALIATGSELTQPGKALLPGKIYDSNSPMVAAALNQMNIRPLFLKRTADRPGAIKAVAALALRSCDFVIFMGGLSAGDTDYVKPVLSQLGVREIFWKVRQKPGKPLYFGKKDNTVVFGLPGNPASVFTCFYEYVYPALRRFMGFPNPYLEAENIALEKSVQGDEEKSLFLKARVQLSGCGRVVSSLHAQASHMLSSLHEANGILAIPPKRSFKKGEKAPVHFLPYAKNSPLGPPSLTKEGGRGEL